MNILYIEDNPQDRALVERYIHTTEHHLQVISKLQEIDLSTANVELLLLDIYFGGKTTGLDYLEQLRAMGVNCPVVAITALTLPQQLANYRRIGIDQVIKKPFEITELANTIAYYEQQLQHQGGAN